MQHSIEEMQAQIAQLQRTLSLPGVPDDEKAIYRATIQKIQEKINATQPLRTEEKRQPPVAPMGHNTPQIGGQEGRGVRVIAPGHTARLSPDQQQAMQRTSISVPDSAAGPATVTIHWPDADWGPVTYTEAEARGRFTTALRDLAESKRAAQGRFDQLPRYTTWWRAVVFYRALCHFWGSPPDRQQLEIRQRSDTYITIFTMLQEAAQHEKA